MWVSDKRCYVGVMQVCGRGVLTVVCETDRIRHVGSTIQEAAKQQAEDTLNAFGRTLPVNPYEIARKLGILVDERPLPSGTSGMILQRPQEDPLLWVACNESPQRQRFTAAHELGHYLERTVVHPMPDDNFGFVDSRDTNHDLHEAFADEYASNLLMPETEFRDAWKATGNLIALSGTFGVSMRAVTFRAKRLGLV